MQNNLHNRLLDLQEGHFTSESATAEERRSAVALQRILNDLKSEGIIFASREEGITEEQFREDIEKAGQPPDDPDPNGFGDQLKER